MNDADGVVNGGEDELEVGRAFDFTENFVRPVRFYSPGGLWGHGSCFLVTLFGKYYAVTAKHVVEGAGAEFHDACILMLGTNIRLPLKGCFFPISSTLEPYHVDLLIYQVDVEAYSACSGIPLRALDLESGFCSAKSFPRRRAIAMGYPATDDRYDFESMNMVDHLVIRGGSIVSSDFEEPIFKLQMSGSSYPVDGMSGGPVISVLDDKVYWLGVVVRGGAEKNSVIHFIDSALVVAAIAQHEKTN